MFNRIRVAIDIILLFPTKLDAKRNKENEKYAKGHEQSVAKLRLSEKDTKLNFNF